MSGEFVDSEARRSAAEAITRMDGHEQLCAERYANIHDRIGLVLKVLAWGGGMVAMILLSLIGFLSNRALQSFDMQQELTRARLEVMEVKATETTPHPG